MVGRAVSRDPSGSVLGWHRLASWVAIAVGLVAVDVAVYGGGGGLLWIGVGILAGIGVSQLLRRTGRWRVPLSRGAWRGAQISGAVAALVQLGRLVMLALGALLVLSHLRVEVGVPASAESDRPPRVVGRWRRFFVWGTISLVLMLLGMVLLQRMGLFWLGTGLSLGAVASYRLSDAGRRRVLLARWAWVGPLAVLVVALLLRSWDLAAFAMGATLPLADLRVTACGEEA